MSLKLIIEKSITVNTSMIAVFIGTYRENSLDNVEENLRFLVLKVCKIDYTDSGNNTLAIQKSDDQEEISVKKDNNHVVCRQQYLIHLHMGKSRRNSSTTSLRLHNSICI